MDEGNVEDWKRKWKYERKKEKKRQIEEKRRK